MYVDMVHTWRSKDNLWESVLSLHWSLSLFILHTWHTCFLDLSALIPDVKSTYLWLLFLLLNWFLYNDHFCLSLLLLIFISFHYWVCVCRSEDNSPLLISWHLGAELSSSGFYGRYFIPLSYLSSPQVSCKQHVVGSFTGFLPVAPAGLELTM